MIRTIALLLLCIVCAAAMTGCRPAPQQGTTAYASSESPVDQDPSLDTLLMQSYYAGQSDRAFRMLYKNIFRNMLEGWSVENFDVAFEQPAWRYETFTRYQILDLDLWPAASDEELYCCAFTGEDGRFGFFILRYEPDGETGGGLRRISQEETGHLYDLYPNMDDIVSKLSETGLDPASVVANRVQLVDAARGLSDEGILFTDSAVNYFYNLYDFSLKRLG